MMPETAICLKTKTTTRRDGCSLRCGGFAIRKTNNQCIKATDSIFVHTSKAPSCNKSATSALSTQNKHLARQQKHISATEQNPQIWRIGLKLLDLKDNKETECPLPKGFPWIYCIYYIGGNKFLISAEYHEKDCYPFFILSYD